MTTDSLQSWWAIDRLPELGPGVPNASFRDALTALTPDTAFPIGRHREAALACISGLWLFHDFLDESHKISQDLSEWFGSYWHGIMHRREPDADNAKYWFRRVGSNEVYVALAKEAGVKHWDPSAFIDECERFRGTGSADENRLRTLQLLEMRVLFDRCHALAVSGSE